MLLLAIGVDDEGSTLLPFLANLRDLSIPSAGGSCESTYHSLRGPSFG